MIICTKHDRRKWMRLIEDIVIEARRGSTRARLFFKGDIWCRVSKELWRDSEDIAEVEKMALTTNKVDDEDVSPSTVRVVTEEKKKANSQRVLKAYYAKKAEKERLAALAKSFPWPSRKELNNAQITSS